MAQILTLHLSRIGGRLGTTRTRILALACCIALTSCDAATDPKASAVPQPAGCTLALAAELPFRNVRGKIIVPARVGGAPVELVLDTGASALVVLNRDAASRLGMLALEKPGHEVWTFTGAAAQGVVDGVAVAVGPLPEETGPIAIEPQAKEAATGSEDGVLGAAFLSRYDVEIDPSAQRVRFHRASGCEEGLVPFAEGYETLQLRQGSGGVLYATITVDQHDLLAMLDTGSNVTMLLQPGFEQLGVAAGKLDLLPSPAGSDAAGRDLLFGILRTSEVLVGETVWHNVRMPVLRTSFRQADAMLGTDFLLRHRILISYQTLRLFLSRRLEQIPFIPAHTLRR